MTLDLDKFMVSSVKYSSTTGVFVVGNTAQCGGSKIEWNSRRTLIRGLAINSVIKGRYL